MKTLKCKIDAPDTYLMLSCENEVEVGLNEMESGAQGMITLVERSVEIRRIGAFVVQRMQGKILVFCRNTENTLEINFRNPLKPRTIPWLENVTMEIVSGGVNRGKRKAGSVCVLRVCRSSIEIESQADGEKEPPQDDQKKKIAEQAKRITELEKQNQQLTASIQQVIRQEEITLTGLTQQLQKSLEDLRDLKAKSCDINAKITSTSRECSDLRTDIIIAGQALADAEKTKAALEEELSRANGAREAVEAYITERRKAVMAKKNLLDFDPEALKKAVEDDLRHLSTDKVAGQFLQADPVLYSDTVSGFLKKAEENLKQADEQLSKLIHLREAIDLHVLETVQMGDGKMDALKEAGYGISASDSENHDKAAAGN